MNEYAGREQEIAAVAQEWAQAKVIGGKARYEQLVRGDIPYLLAQLGEAREKLAAVEKRIKFHSICFEESRCTLPAELLHILKGGD